MFFTFIFNKGNIVRQCQSFDSLAQAMLHVQLNSSATDQWQINRQEGYDLIVINETKGFGDSYMAFKTFLRHYCRHQHPQAYHD